MAPVIGVLTTLLVGTICTTLIKSKCPSKASPPF
jgi:hypothetical protein